MKIKRKSIAINQDLVRKIADFRQYRNDIKQTNTQISPLLLTQIGIRGLPPVCLFASVMPLLENHVAPPRLNE